MQNKYKLTRGAKRQAAGVIENYELYKSETHAEEERITAFGSGIGRYQELSNGDRAYLPNGSGAVSSPTENKALQLERLHSSHKYKCICSVDSAFNEVLKNYNNELAAKLRECITDSCKNSKKLPFEHMGIIGIERSRFYQLKYRVLYIIAEQMGF